MPFEVNKSRNDQPFSTQIYQRLFRMTASHEVKLNLEIPHLLDKFLNFPHRAYPCIHVAGTNGKGSVVTKIAKALELSGLKVGRYTSPHLVDFRERMAVQGEWISEAAVVEGMQRLFDFIDEHKIPATFFELTTLLAFDYFRANQVDVAVIETGLGGRLDATNIIHPILTVITSISRDHADLLGETLDEIAEEKAGILKPFVPVVLGARATYEPILKKAHELNCPCVVAPSELGFYDLENRATARAALDLLAEHFSVPNHAIEEGLSFRPASRFEKLGDVIFDVAHNPDGFTRLFEALDQQYPERSIFVVLGMSKDKEYEKCLSLVAKRAQKIFLIRAESGRAAETDELASTLIAEGYTKFVEGKKISSTVKLAMEEAKDAQALLLICGSFFIMEEARQAITGRPYPPTDLFGQEVLDEPNEASMPSRSP